MRGKAGEQAVRHVLKLAIASGVFWPGGLHCDVHCDTLGFCNADASFSPRLSAIAICID
jgi:hypothetical protein